MHEWISTVYKTSGRTSSLLSIEYNIEVQTQKNSKYQYSINTVSVINIQFLHRCLCKRLFISCKLVTARLRSNFNTSLFTLFLICSLNTIFGQIRHRLTSDHSGFLFIQNIYYNYWAEHIFIKGVTCVIVYIYLWFLFSK